MRQNLPCLNDFITAGTVANCEPEASISGLYLTDIAGVTGSILADLANEEDKTISDFSARILARAVLRFKELLSSYLSQLGFAIREGYISSKKDCKHTSVTVPQAAANRGLVIEKPVKGLPLYGAFFVNFLQLKAAQSADVLVSILDGEGVVLWQKNVTITADQTKTVQVQMEFLQDAIYIVWDNTAIDVYSVKCAGGGCNSCPKPCSQNITERYSISGWDGSQKVANEQYGIIFEGGFKCSFDAFVCANVSTFASAILSLCEAEIYTAMQRSTRLNLTTIFQDPSAVAGYIEKAKNTAAKRIREQLTVLLPAMRENAAFCLTCNQFTGAVIQTR